MTQVIKKKENLPTINPLEEFANQGAENITAADVKIPLLKLIGNMSPQINAQDAQFVKGLNVGDIYNDVSGSIYQGKTGFLAVPCLFINTFNEWSERGTGSTRPTTHLNREIMSKTERGADGKDWLPNTESGERRYIEDTGNHFVYILDENYVPIEQALITMKSTQKKKSKLWNSMIQSRKLKGKNGYFQPPSWATVYRLASVQERNDKGQWPGWSISYDSDLSANPNAMGLTKAFYEDAKKSDIFGKVNFDDDAQEPIKKEDVPF